MARLAVKEKTFSVSGKHICVEDNGDQSLAGEQGEGKAL